MDNKSQANPGRPVNCQNCHLPRTVCTCGRPTKFTEETLSKLHEAYSIGANHEQAAYHAKVSLSTLHGWMKQNPNLRELVDGWRQRPTLRALNKVFESLATDTNSAWRWLERRHPDFMPVHRHKLSGDNDPENKPIKIERIIVHAPPEYQPNPVDTHKKQLQPVDAQKLEA